MAAITSLPAAGDGNESQLVVEAGVHSHKWMSRRNRAGYLASHPAFGWPLFRLLLHAHYTSAANGCINNLRQIDAAVQEFALENHLTNGSPVHFPTDLTPYIKLNRDGKMPPCPAGGIYRIERVGEIPTCSLGMTVTPAHYLP